VVHSICTINSDSAGIQCFGTGVQRVREHPGLSVVGHLYARQRDPAIIDDT
jgi:hypothetical protein